MSARRRGHPLTRDELLDAALAIVDAEGLAALTMRRLAEAVGVEAMSLYHHVPSKETLLDWTTERMRSEMRLPDPLPKDWPSVLETIFAEYRRVLGAHPNMLPLATRPTDGAEASGLRYLVEQGIPPDDAVELYQSLVAFTVGYSVVGSPLIEPRWVGLPDDLARRLADWRDATFRRTLRIVMEGYRTSAPVRPGAIPGPGGSDLIGSAVAGEVPGQRPVADRSAPRDHDMATVGSTAPWRAPAPSRAARRSQPG